MRKYLVLAILLMTTALGAAADHYADFYVIPVAARTPGLNGTNWMSDVAIQNFQSAPLTVQFVVIESGFSNDNVFPLTTPQVAGSTTIPARGSVMLKDLLNGHRGLETVVGSLLVGADRPFAVTSRTYSMLPAGDTVGQTVPPVGNFLDNTLSQIDLPTAVAWVPGLVQNASFRTNLGFVAANGSGSGAPMTLAITVRDAGGAAVGTRTFIIPAGAAVHAQFSARELGDVNYDVGSAEFRITSGSGSVAPYASVIDNRTADAVFVSGVFPKNPAPAAKDGARGVFRTLFDTVTGR